MRDDVFAHDDETNPALTCPYLVACDHRCSLADARFWRPRERLESTTCRTFTYVTCPRFVAASRPLRRDDRTAAPDASPNCEAERTLNRIGVGALGCVAGVVISALAFLLLPVPQGATGSDYQSLVAGVMATPAPKPAFTACAVQGHQMTAAEQGEEIPRPTPHIEPALVEVEEEPLPPPAPSARYATGVPASGDETTHIVQQGETLWGIARDNGIDPRELAARNGLDEDALIAAGDTLVIPSTSVDSQP